jgi:hypothetical protein
MIERYDINPEVAYREIEGQVLLLTPDDDVLYTLNGTGKLVWELLVSGSTPKQIVERTASVYGIPVETAERDVAAFLDQLERKGVVSRGTHIP